jgi:hypothetical protein
MFFNEANFLLAQQHQRAFVQELPLWSPSASVSSETAKAQISQFKMEGKNGTDFFAFVMEESCIKTFSIVFTFLMIVFMTPPLYFIKMFDSVGSNQSKTFINRLVALLCR